jgi:multiple sugar transport system permease protein
VSLVLTLFPFYWMLVTSVKPEHQLFSLEANPLYTLQPTLDHYRYLFQQTLIIRWFLNTMAVSLAATAISLTVSIPAGYAIARLSFPGAAMLGTLIFAFYLVPRSLLFIPMSMLITTMGLANTYWALILVYPTFLIPFGTWLLSGYFRALPRDMEECALVDGCTKIGAMIRVALPLAVPGIVSVFIFAFTHAWNDFIYSLTLITDTEMKTLPVGIVTELIRGDLWAWGPLMAAGLLASLPVVVFYAFFADYFVSGLTAGAVKG